MSADGQKIAKRLCIQISKETKNIKSMLPVYNACQSSLVGGRSMLIIEALDPSSFSTVLLTQPLYSESKQELIEAYLVMRRSTEEISMLKMDMKNTLRYYEDKKETLLQLIESMAQRDDTHARGTVALLRHMLIDIDNTYKECSELFSNTGTDYVHPTIIDCDSDNSDTDNSDTDSDVDEL